MLDLTRFNRSLLKSKILTIRIKGPMKRTSISPSLYFLCYLVERTQGLEEKIGGGM